MFKSHVKVLVLRALAEQRQSGYDLIKRLASLQPHRPSPGYIYPLLRELQQSGFVRVHAQGRRKVYSLTTKGRALLARMQKSQEETLRRITRTMGPLADRAEIEQVLDFRTNFFRYKDRIAGDMDLYAQLHAAMYAVYDLHRAHARTRMRAILRASIERLHALVHAQSHAKELRNQ